MSCTLAVFVPFVCLVALLGPVDSNGKFMLKKNADGTYLLVPAPANASLDSTVDLNSLPPIAVASSTPVEAPGVNSQSPPIPVQPNSPAAPAPSGVQVGPVMEGLVLITMLIIKITISSIVIGFNLPSCYRTVCYWTVCYRTVQ